MAYLSQILLDLHLDNMQISAKNNVLLTSVWDFLMCPVQPYRPLSRNAQTKDFARLTSHSVRG